MPTPAEIAAAVAALRERREQSRLSNGPWPSIEEEVRIVLEAAEAVRNPPPPTMKAAKLKDVQDDG
jgi:hypothetical protein